MGPNLLFGGGPVRASPSQFGLTLITSATCTRLWAIKAPWNITACPGRGSGKSRLILHKNGLENVSTLWEHGRRLHPVPDKLGFFLPKILYTPMGLTAAMQYSCLKNRGGGFI